MSDPRELVLLSKAQRALAEASTIDEVKDIRDKAAAVKAYAQKARLGKSLVVEASAVRIRAERRLGQMLLDTPLATSSSGNQHTVPGGEPPPEAVLLEDLGITKNESSRSQRIAQLDDPDFEQYLAGCQQTEREPTFAGLLRLLRAHDRPPKAGKTEKRPALGLDSEVMNVHGTPYSTILAIPPWPGCTPPGRPALTTDELCELPVGTLCRPQAHLYIWTSNRYLVDAFDLVDAWGFAYRASFACIYEESLPETPWDDAHHLILLATQGDLAFRKGAQQSWLKGDRCGHGLVPREIRDLIETASPGPYLEILGHDAPPNSDWAVYPTITDR